MKQIAALCILIMATTFSVAAQAGSLDPAFGIGGTQLISPPVIGGLVQQDAVLQLDGKVVSLVDEQLTSWTMIRLNTDGSLDTSFAGDGIVDSSWQMSPSLPSGIPSAMAIDAAGSFVLVGWWRVPQGRNSYVEKLRVDRFMTDGSIDTSFGTNGTALFSLPSPDAVVIQPIGKIVILCGTLVVRLNANGTLDTSFGNSGTAPSGLSYAYSAKAMADGKILVAGNYTSGSDSLMCVNRLNVNGGLDATFGNAGRATANFFGRGSYGRATRVETDAFGNIIAGGIARRKSSTETDFAAARFTSSGQPDTSFNGTGRATYAFLGQGAFAWSAVVQSDGKVIVTGDARNAASNNSDDFTLIRFNFDGTIDTTFGSNGVTRTDVDSTRSDYSRSALIWTDSLCGCEKITVVGFSIGGAAFVRYLTY